MAEIDIGEKISKGGLLAQLIIEIAGKPLEHVESTMKLVLQRIKEEKGVFVTEGKIHKAKETGKYFTSFAEIECAFDGFADLVRVCYDYMPSSVEIIEPSDFKVKSGNVSDFINDILARLHDIDMKLKSTNAAIIILEQNATNLLKRALVVLLKQSPKELGFLSKQTGIPENQLEPFLKNFEGEGWVKKDGNSYTLLREPSE